MSLPPPAASLANLREDLFSLTFNSVSLVAAIYVILLSQQILNVRIILLTNVAQNSVFEQLQISDFFLHGAWLLFIRPD